MGLTGSLLGFSVDGNRGWEAHGLNRGGPFNRFLIHTMKDEIRQLGPELFIGTGMMAAGGGAMNPAPFALFGKPELWRGSQES